MANQLNYYDDEIDLRGCINVLIKRKITIFAVLFICVIIAVVYNLNTPKIYQAETTISIARVEEAVISPKQVAWALTSQQVLEPVVSNLPDLSKKQLKQNLKVEALKNADSIKLTLTDQGRRQAIKILEEITANFIDRFNSQYQQRIALIENQIEILTGQKQQAEKQIEALREKEETGDIAVYTVLQETLSTYQKNYLQIINNIFKLRKKIIQAQGFSVTEPAEITGDPLKPKTAQNIVIAVVIGLMLGAFIAFFREFWINSAGEEEEKS
jgi:uncharacterized protein involved in exopolysaccharide biosynthesis